MTQEATTISYCRLTILSGQFVCIVNGRRMHAGCYYPACWLLFDVQVCTCVMTKNRTYLNRHPVALKVEVDDIPNLLGRTMLASHHDVQQTTRWVNLQSLAHSCCQAI